MRVLLVDDETELVSALAERLGLRGIDARWADTAQEAENLMREQAFDAAVLDLRMPGCPGLELMARLQAARPGLRCVIMSGDAHGVQGDVPCLHKPVDMAELLQALGHSPD